MKLTGPRSLRSLMLMILEQRIPQLIRFTAAFIRVFPWLSPLILIRSEGNIIVCYWLV